MESNTGGMIPSASQPTTMQVHIPRLAREHYETREYVIGLQKQLLNLVGLVNELIQSVSDKELEKVSAKKK